MEIKFTLYTGDHPTPEIITNRITDGLNQHAIEITIGDCNAISDIKLSLEYFSTKFIYTVLNGEMYYLVKSTDENLYILQPDGETVKLLCMIAEDDDIEDGYFVYAPKWKLFGRYSWRDCHDHSRIMGIIRGIAFHDDYHSVNYTDKIETEDDEDGYSDEGFITDEEPTKNTELHENATKENDASD